MESTEDQSCVSRSCVVSARGTARERHTVAILLIWMVSLSPMRNERCTLASIVLNPRRFEGLLVDFDSGYSESPFSQPITIYWYATSLHGTLFSRASAKPHFVILC